MIYLILCILASVGIFVIFKLADKKGINLYSVIFINYIIATLLGFFLNDINLSLSYVLNSPWFFLAAIIGIMFTGTFFLIGFSTKKAGIAVTSVSAKLSLVIPTTFSIFYDPADAFSWMKLSGIILALVAVVFLVWKKRTEKINLRYVFLPVLLFLGLGLVDAFVKFAQQDYLDEYNLSVFSTFVFLFAFFTALIAGFIIRYDFRKIFNLRSTIAGITLGIFNFGTIYFIVLALNFSNLPGSSVFGINNMGTILTSVLIAILFFNEKLTLLNKAGILISLVAIWMLVQV